MLCLALLLGGCRSLRESSVGPEVATGSDTGTRPAAAAPTPVSSPQREYTVMNFDAVAEGIRATGQLRVAKDSAMWVAVYKIVELGRAMATTDSVWLDVPFMGRYFAGTYAELSKAAKRTITYRQLQEAALADNAAELIAALAAEMGIAASVDITARRQVLWLSMPFRKQRL